MDIPPPFISAQCCPHGFQVSLSDLHHVPGVNPVITLSVIRGVQQCVLRPNLHYTEHRLRSCCTTTPKDTTNGRAHNNSIQQICHIAMPDSPTSRHVKMLGRGKFLSVGGEFVVDPTTSCRTVVSSSVGGVRSRGVRVVEFGTNTTRFSSTKIASIVNTCQQTWTESVCRSRRQHSGPLAVTCWSYYHLNIWWTPAESFYPL